MSIQSIGETNKQQSSRQSSRRLKKQFNVYLSQTSQLNPFGPNSIHISYDDKVVYKYNLMKQHILLSKKDQLHKEYEQSRFLGIMILGFVGGYFAALAVTTLLRKTKLMKPNHSLSESVFYASCMTGGFGYCYFQAHKRYNKNVCKYFLEKYISQAVQNGFKNYEISI